jgi:hypothetical protein
LPQLGPVARAGTTQFDTDMAYNLSEVKRLGRPGLQCNIGGVPGSTVPVDRSHRKRSRKAISQNTI